jgi:CheY-like chemotaxis protein
MLAEVTEIDVDLDWVSRLSSGLDRYAGGGVDVVLLDLALPDSQGLDTLRTVHSQLPHAPVVVLTGLDDGARAFSALREGAQDYLVKCHFDSASLIRSVRHAVERKRIEEELELKTAILSTQFELCADGVLVVDEQRRIIHFNRRFMDLWSIPLEVMEAGSDKRVQHIILCSLADRRGLVARLTRLYGDHAISKDELELKDGKTFECDSAPMFGSGERCCGRIWLFRDISRWKQTEEELRMHKRLSGIQSQVKT